VAAEIGADDLFPILLSQIIFLLVDGDLSLYAELEFAKRFCRDDLLLIGKFGYVLTTIDAALAAVEGTESLSDLLRLVMP
jgi:hypothetical protein